MKYKRMNIVELNLRIAYMRGRLDRAKAVFGPGDIRVTSLENRVAYYEWVMKQHSPGQ